MKEIALEIQVREGKTKSSRKNLRQSDRIPGIVYGAGKEPLSVSVDGKQFAKVLHGEAGSNVLIKLSHPQEKDTVIVKQLQRHVVSTKVIHVDFQRVSMSQKLEVQVPLHTVGEAPGVKLSGGVLEHILHEVKVRCLPKDIPQNIPVDVSNLAIGQAIHVKDLPVPAGVEILLDSSLVVVHVSAPTILEEPTVAAAAPEATEPEVIKKGKKEEEGAEGEAKAPAAGKGAEAAPKAAEKPVAKK